MGRIDTSHLTPAPADEELRLTSFDGTELHVEVRGPEGAPIVLLAHGWTMSTLCWTKQYSELAESYRVVSYDQRGHGRSGVPGIAGFNPEALPADLATVVEATVPPGEKAVFVGHSMGAMTIVGAAGQRPALIADRCAAVVLASTGVDELVLRNRVVPLPMPLGKLFKRISMGVMSAKVKLRAHPDRVSRFVVRYVTMGRGADLAELEYTTADVLGCNSQIRGTVGRMLAELDLSPHVENLHAPTIVIVGDEDRLTPVWHARRLAEVLPDCVGIVEVPGVGHMSPIEAPEAVNGAVHQLVASYLPAVRRAS